MMIRLSTSSTGSVLVTLRVALVMLSSFVVRDSWMCDFVVRTGFGGPGGLAG
jgi:hypothetical protein